MPIIDPLEEDQIEPALREHVQFFKGPLGVVPNSVRTMARRPDIARAFTDLNIAVMECAGKVTPEFKRLIGFATSMVSGCRYCQAHTVLGSERFGTTEERLNSIFDYARSPHFTSAEKAALDFAFAAAEIPNGVTDEHAENLRANWSDEDLVEWVPRLRTCQRRPVRNTWVAIGPWANTAKILKIEYARQSV